MHYECTGSIVVISSMRQNAQRRNQLLDGAIRLLAQEGAGGLSYRTLDSEAGMPTGTSSNYFRTRGDLLVQVIRRIHERLQPDPEFLTSLQNAGGIENAVNVSLQDLLSRARRDRDAYLALLEMRLLAQRQPELKTVLLPVIRENLHNSQQLGNLEQSDMDFTLLYLTVSGLLFEELTMPEALLPLTSEEIIQALLAKTERQ